MPHNELKATDATETTNQADPTRLWPNTAIRDQFGAEYASARLANWIYSTTPAEKAAQARVIQEIESMCIKIADLIESAQTVLIFGQCGTGKDRLMTSLVRAAMNCLSADRRAVMRVSGATLWARVRDGLVQRELETSILAEICEPRVLVISDPVLPGQESTSMQQDWLYRLLEKRRRESKSTWFTSNASDDDELSLILGAANYSRIIDGSVIICCEWNGFRRAKKIVE